MTAGDIDAKPGPVDIATLFAGFERARERFMNDRLGTDPAVVFMSIFEALNWSVSIEEQLRDSGIPLGDEEIVRAVRYARNAVHHRWADALEVTDGAQLPAVLPAPLFEWRWTRDLPPPRNPTGKEEYDHLVAGQPVRYTLDSLSLAFSSTSALLTNAPVRGVASES